jgi:hypothetical protein
MVTISTEEIRCDCAGTRIMVETRRQAEEDKPSINSPSVITG